jgi:tetratricopeptide (TPR) repeat protein
MYLQTMAAAYAETGNYKDAIATARRALDLAIQHKNDLAAGQARIEMLADRIRTEMKHYEAAVPARDSLSHWDW